MRNKTIRFLTVSLILVSLLCAAIFSFLAVYMNRRSTEAIREVGGIYMSGMSEQISMHFGTTMCLRLSQLEAIVETYPAGSTSEESLREELAYSAKARGFESLAFCSADGSFEMIFGTEAEVVDLQPFLESLTEGQMKIAVAMEDDGDKVVLMGIPAAYRMDGGNCVALVAGLPVDYISTTLSLDEDNSLVYSHIIRRDGSFVIRSGDAFRDTYFDRIRETCQTYNGTTPEMFVEQLEQAMDAGRDYSGVFQTEEGRNHIYCTSLPYSEWHLVTIMPYGALDQTVNNLGRQWMVMVLGGCSVILLALVLVFLKYLSMTRQQMTALDEARKEAIHAAQAKSEFLSNMSHDIRTPMNAIVGMTAIATANMDNPQQVQNCLKKITLSSKHLLGLINDVLDMSKIESGKMTLNMDQVSLREVVDSIVNIVQPQIRSKHQKFDVVIRDISTENVCCDSVRLNQVMLNLLSNAIKFTPEGGTIGLSLYEESSDKGEGFVCIHIIVKDNGIGMSEEFQKKIFESFVREDSARVHHTEGSGLGMAITKYIVDAMKGTITLHSVPGQGTEFDIKLDLEKAEVQEADMVLPNWNMLVVDDDRLLCESTVDSLKAIGITAEWALSGEEAIEKVDKHRRLHDDYHIILLDWKLPGIDGIETAKRIRTSLGGDVPILLISAYDWGEIEESAREAGINGFISKPLFKSTLFHGLRRYVEEESLNHVEIQTESRHADFAGRHVLLAEDNELNWEVAAELLSELGLELDWAEDGKICVEMFEKSEIGHYDAILMDLRMPVMNGYEATEAIRKSDRADRDIPIIAMTADAFSDDIKKCLDSGMDSHMAKPIDIREVARLLEKYFK